MKKSTKFMAVVLAVLFILNILLSCSKTTNNVSVEKDNTISGGQDGGGSNAEDGAVQAKLEPDLPDMDFNGYTFTFLTHLYSGDDWISSTPLEFVSEEETGEPLNDAVYKRNSIITERYNIDIKIVPASDERGALNKAVKAGDSLYDAVLMFNNNVPGVVTNDLLLDTSNLPYIDLSKPWWDPAIKSMSIMNKNYLLAGDILILDNEATNCLIFNKNLMANLGIELPYNAVKKGKWTMDMLNITIKGTAADLNGDGEMRPYDDRWGLSVFNDTLLALLISGGGSLAEKNSDDIPYMSFNSERNIAVFEKAMSLYNPEYTVNMQNMPAGSAPYTKYGQEGFGEDKILFMWTRMRVVEKYRGMESNFGIVPMPKYDEGQERYYSLVNPYTGALLGVPKTAEDLERVSIILEAMAAEARYTIQPAYYDVVLQRKYVRDEESGEMLDIIFNSRVYDIGSIYSFGNIASEILNLAKDRNGNILTLYERKLGAMEAAIEKIVAIFESMQ